MTLLEQIEAIYGICEQEVGDDPNACLQAMDWAQSMTARVTKMLADANKTLTDRKKEWVKTLTADQLTKSPATVVKILVEAACRDEQYIVDRLEGLLKALHKRHESCQSNASFSKSTAEKQMMTQQQVRKALRMGQGGAS